METADIKRKLINEINLSNNKDLSEELYRFLNVENEIQEIYNLTDEQKDAIKDARNQIQKDDFLTNEEANKEIDEWLNK